jgi:hypothetical protein
MSDTAKQTESVQKLVEILKSTNEEYKKFMSKADSDWGKQDFSSYNMNLEQSAHLIAELPEKARVYLENIETEKRGNYEYWLEYYARLAREAIGSENAFKMTVVITDEEDDKNKIEELFLRIQKENGL